VYVLKHEQRMGLWPALWLAEDLRAAGVRARVLALTYDADVWASSGVRPHMPLEQVAAHACAQLAAAGVGAGGRATVFLTHSMGGLLTKHILAGGEESGHPACAARVAGATAGVLFYGVPHVGAPLAEWGLNRLSHVHRWVRAPSPHVHALMPSEQLARLNADFGALAGGRGIGVLSVAEGAATYIPAAAGIDLRWGAPAAAAAAEAAAAVAGAAGNVAGAPRPPASAPPTALQVGPVAVPMAVRIVPPAAANPGYGAFEVVPNADHINVCKPDSRDDARYVLARDFVLRCVRGARGGLGQGLGGGADGMAGALSAVQGGEGGHAREAEMR
jgi:hypothetical protein